MATERSADARVRVARPEDAYDIARIYTPFVTESIISFEEVPPTAEETERKIAGTTQTYPWLIAEAGREVAGFAYACRHRDRAAYRWAVDVSAYVDPRFHRRGIASSLYRELFAILRRQGFANAYAGIALPNEASVGLHESLGFRPVGVYEEVGFKLGGWHSVGWWELSMQEKQTPPREPVPFSRLG